MNDRAPAPSPSPPPADPPDLSRLRIPRDRRGDGRYRGFPWALFLLVLAVAGGLWLFRVPLLGLARGVAGPAYATGRATRVVPGRDDGEGVAANGYVVADRTASLATVLSGRLVELNAEEGDIVEENAVVARIQYDDLEAQWQVAQERVAVAEAQVVQAEASLEATRLELPRLEALLAEVGRQRAEAQETLDRLDREVKRNLPLFEKALIDEGTWDRIQADARIAAQNVLAIEARLHAADAARQAWEGRIRAEAAQREVARGQVDTARREAEIAEIVLEKTRIRAPFRGLVIRKDAELGEVIAPTGAGNSRGSVFTIVDPESLEMQVELSEKRIRKVAEGDGADVYLDADPDTRFPARVRKIWPRADRSKGTIEVRVAFEARPPDLRPEMAGRVVFRGEAAPQAAGPEAAYVTVPARAVARRGTEDVVFVVSGGRASRRLVRLGPAEGDRRRVEEGLTGGETVLLDPPPDLSDGQAVRTEETK